MPLTNRTASTAPDASDGAEPAPTPRRQTTTRAFGSSKRENHDASDFYGRFAAPKLSDDTIIAPPVALDRIFVDDARAMNDSQVADGSVALVVTSPPYFAGKQYEQAMGEGHIPADYVAFLDMLEAVFARCVDKLEPGGRIAVNVANLGRRPYRSLSADVIGILQDRLGLLLRGEIIWHKARGAGGSCAWGSFQSPANPVLRDLSERVIVASKGRFDRANSRNERAKAGLPATITVSKDDFMDATTDLWELSPESATRVNHPAPFPVELPERLIHLYTYEGDLVLDPFMGSGSTGIAAVKTGRHYVGFDTDADYAAAATARIEAFAETAPESPVRLVPKASVVDDADEPPNDDPIAEARRNGEPAKELARLALEHAGFTQIKNRRFGGLAADFTATDAKGGTWRFLCVGTFAIGGLRRTDAVLKAIGIAAVARSVHPDDRVVVLTIDHLAGGDTALKAAMGTTIEDAIDYTEPDDLERLAVYGSG